MTAPFNWSAPVIRLGALLSANWNGPDDDLSLDIQFLDNLGTPVTRSLRCTADGVLGDVCLPSSATILDVPDETVIAHVRMAGWVRGSVPVPGSTEWLALFQDEGEIPDFQLAIGNARIYAARPVSDVEFEFDIRKKGTSSPTKTVRTDYGTIRAYNLDPSETVRCIAGGIELRHPTYVHNYPTQVLSEAQKDAIIATVMSEDLDTGLNNLWM